MILNTDVSIYEKRNSFLTEAGGVDRRHLLPGVCLGYSENILYKNILAKYERTTLESKQTVVSLDRAEQEHAMEVLAS